MLSTALLSSNEHVGMGVIEITSVPDIFDTDRADG
jgi:hypothetical protein